MYDMSLRRGNLLLHRILRLQPVISWTMKDPPSCHNRSTRTMVHWCLIYGLCVSTFRTCLRVNFSMQPIQGANTPVGPVRGAFSNERTTEDPRSELDSMRR